MSKGFSVADSVALVTGANRGIGEAIVDALVAAGARKVYAAARRREDLDALLSRHGEAVQPLELDVTDSEQVLAAAQAASDVQLLINNAGVASYAMGAFDDPQWLDGGRQDMEVNFFGTFAMSQAFAPLLSANGGGAIVNLAAVASLVNCPVLAAYSASKAATHSLTQAARLMLKAQGTQVFGVYPGPIDTRMAEGFEMDKTPPSEVARAILEGVGNGTEEIYPDAVGVQFGVGYAAAPKALEAQVEAMFAA